MKDLVYPLFVSVIAENIFEGSFAFCREFFSHDNADSDMLLADMFNSYNMAVGRYTAHSRSTDDDDRNLAVDDLKAINELRLNFLNYAIENGFDYNISKDFRLSEMVSSDAAFAHEVDNRFTESEQVINLVYLVYFALQPIRDYFGKPVYITSAYRCTKLNNLVGGVVRSRHLVGRAADIKISDSTGWIDPLKVQNFCAYRGIEFIKYDTFTHVQI